MTSTLPQQRTLTAGCKVNLYLDITGVRPNGYHELHTLFVPLAEPADTLTVTPAEGSGLRLTCSRPELEGPDNIIIKAYEAFAEATGFRPGLRVHLDKRIPFGAGLGGGSSDAAAILRYLNDSAGQAALEHTALSALATRIGADVPFFLLDGPAWATGIGEELVPAELDLAGFTLVVLCPDIHVSTPWAYAAWDAAHPATQKNEKRPECLTCAASAGKCFPCSAFLLHNSFEHVVFGAFPKLRQLKEALLRQGAAGAVMSGSGSSLCALFRNRQDAERAVLTFRQEQVPAFFHSF